MSSEKANQESAVTTFPFRILKIATCPSLSGKSQLTYHIGCVVDGEANRAADSEILFRVVANTGSGFYSHGSAPRNIDRCDTSRESTVTQP